MYRRSFALFEGRACAVGAWAWPLAGSGLARSFIVWPGAAGLGGARHGGAGQGKASVLCCGPEKMNAARRGSAWRGRAGQGKAGRGLARAV
jgi:hypothetical protein